MNNPDSAEIRQVSDRWLAAAGVLGALGVALGAFGAHGLRTMLASASDAEQRLAWWETAARYHLFHALACAAGAWAIERSGGVRAARVSSALFVVGVTIFSGTLYAMTLGAPRWLGAITPIGGVSLIAGWIALAISARRAR